jgi:putative membrane protein
MASELKAQLPALVSACTVLALGISIHQLAIPPPLGPLSRHMAVHIALMNVAAPICAAVLWLTWPAARLLASGTVLWTATIGQMVLLWVWHAPAIHAAAMPSLLAQTLWHSSLLLSALLFWRALLPARGAGWQSIFALLLTGKLVCLLAVLLVFSPRPLYLQLPGAAAKHAIEHAAGRPDLADQHVAGLLMLAACPLSYVLAGIILAAQSISELARTAQPVRNYRRSAVC